MAGAFWGGFSQGLAGGLQQGQELRLKKEEHQLKAKMIEHQIKTQQLTEQKAQQALADEKQQQAELGKYVDMLGNGMPGQPPAPLQPGQEGPLPAPDFQVPNRSATQPELLGQSLKSVPREHRYNLIQESMKPKVTPADLEQQFQTMIKYGLIKPPPEASQPGNIQSPALSPQQGAGQTSAVPASPGVATPTAIAPNNNQVGFTVSPRGMTVRSNPEPIPRGTNSRIFVDYQKEQRALGKSDEQIRNGWNEYLRNQSEARATGGFDAKGNPINQGAQRDINRAGAQGSQLGALDVQSGAPYQQTQQDIAAKRALGGEQAKASAQLVGMSGTTALVDKIAELSAKLPAGEWLGRFVEGGKLKVGALSQSNPDAAQLEQLRESYSNILNRSLLAEKGVLTDQDRKFASDAIPSLFDTKEMRQRKVFMFKTLNNILLNGEQALAAGKFDPQAFRKAMNNMNGGATNQPTQGPKTADEYLKSLGR